MKKRAIVSVLVATMLVQFAAGKGEPMKLASVPAPMPDGKRFVFEWDGDIWSASVRGGGIKQLTSHPATDHWPCVSPDGKMIAFTSNRDDTRQVYIMPADGGFPRQITFHTEGATPLCWFPDGKSILVRAVRDQVDVGEPSTRLFRVPTDGSGSESLLFNAYAHEVDIAPDGHRILFTRDGVDLYRKGYHGSLAAKIWMYDINSGDFSLLCDDPGGNRSPMWRPDGKAFYYVSQKSGCFNVWEHNLENGSERQLTDFKKDAVIMPRLSRNGRVMIFRNLFDFYRLDPTSDKKPARIKLYCNRDRARELTRRRWYSGIYNNAGDGSLDWTNDGLQMCFTAGGDLWVMDTVLREPVAVTKESDIHETEAVFTPDNKAICFLRDFGDRVNIWKAERTDTNTFWWRQSDFKLTELTTNTTAKYNLSISPDGSNVAYCVTPGTIMVADIDGSNAREVARSVFEASYDWSPDGKWMVCALSDSDGNRDVWIVSVDGKHKPYNLSRHPKWDGDPRWSPDGRKIAFVGRRHDNTVGIFYVYLQKKDEVHSGWELKLEQALKTMGKTPHKPKEEPVDSAAAEDDDTMQIDFKGLHTRLHRIAVDSTSGNLFWSYDSKALAYNARVGGKSGTWKSIFPNKLSPNLITSSCGTQAKWIRKGGKILWLLNGKPANLTKTYSFSAYQETNIADYRRLAFRQIWRTLRDRFYNAEMNGSDWNGMLKKYEDMAADSPNLDIFFRTVSMLLGELNASHLSFTETDSSKREWRQEWRSRSWNVRTGHTGLLFDRHDKGPGLLVRHVIEKGPADQDIGRISVGERITKINGVDVAPDMAWFRTLTGRYPREDELTVLGTNGESRTLSIHTISYEEARNLIKEEYIKSLADEVDTLSKSKIGYLHIARMQWEDLYRFEQEVFARGFGKDGLVVDVRSNPGGFVADRLLDIFCHPRHAITVPRGGNTGYPIGYLGRAVWNKPIVVLCNQYTGSNGEIFCHAIKTLHRGRLVGVATRGAVISTPRVNILDMGSLAVPDRGWYVGTSGADMELNGAAPDVVVRRGPASVDSGRDLQLEAAVKALSEDIIEYQKHPAPAPVNACRLRKNSQRH